MKSYLMTWPSKKVGIILLAFFVLFATGAGQAGATTMARIVGPDYTFYPILEEVGVNPDGSLVGTVLVEPEFKLVSLVIDNSNGERQQEIYLLGGLDPDQGLVTSVKPIDYKIETRSGESTSIHVDLLRFHIPAELLEVVPGEYTIYVKARTSLVYVSHLTREVSSAKQTIIFPERSAESKLFPGEIKVTKEGGIQITIQQMDDYAKAKYYLVILDHREQEVKRISFNPKNPKIASKDLQLPVGEYLVFLELIDKDITLRSNVVTISIKGLIQFETEPLTPTGIPASPAAGNGTGGTVPAGTGTGSPGTGSNVPGSGGSGGLPGGKNFPGSVNVTPQGTIQITLTITAEYEKARFALLIIDEQNTVVKRIPINLKNPSISLKGLGLPGGTYTIVIEMAQDGQTYRSLPVEWELPVEETTTVVFPIPSGQNFPGGVTVNPNGTITVNLEWKQSYDGYQVYIVIFDIYGNVVKRVPINLSNPTFSIDTLQLGTGGYSVVIEVVDPRSGQSATSAPSFITVNQTREIVIFIDGELQSFPMVPVKIDGRTLVPMRAIFEAFGAKVDWDDANQTVTATKDGNVIKLTIGSKVAFKNGQPIPLDVPAILYNGNTTMVPIRFVSEALGAKVEWDPYSNSVIISN